MISPQILTALDDIGPMSAYELSLLLNAEPGRVTQEIAAMKTQGKVHICRFEPSEQSLAELTPVFAVGSEKDATPQERKLKSIDNCLRKNAIASTQVGMWAGLLR